MKKYSLILLFSVFLFSSCMNEPEIQPNTYQGNFEALWKIIDTKYCYLDYKNINWDSIRTVYSDSISDVETDFAFFDLMGKMLGELKDGHVNLYSSFDRSRYWKWYTDYPANFSSSLIYSSRYIGNNYRIANGFRYGKIDNGRIGYIYYGSFSDGYSDSNMRYILSHFSDCEGLIIDVRNNGGGSIDNSKRLASYFMKEEKITGFMRHKTGTGHSDFSDPVAIKTPAHKTIHWGRPVAVLTNRMSYSATNDFTNRMRMTPKTVVVGDKTGGGGGLPLSSEIPNGWMVRFSAAPMFDADMNHTEWGIEPNVKDSITPEDYANGIDPIIERAIILLKQD